MPYHKEGKGWKLIVSASFCTEADSEELFNRQRDLEQKTKAGGGETMSQTRRSSSMLARLLVGALSLGTPTAVVGYDDRLEEIDFCDKRFRGKR